MKEGRREGGKREGKEANTKLTEDTLLGNCKEFWENTSETGRVRKGHQQEGWLLLGPTHLSEGSVMLSRCQQNGSPRSSAHPDSSSLCD